jgi:hypothetical protein
MCYNNCQYSSFNPITGEDRCRLPKGAQCPDEVEAEDEIDDDDE